MYEVCEALAIKGCQEVPAWVAWPVTVVMIIAGLYLVLTLIDALFDAID